MRRIDRSVSDIVFLAEGRATRRFVVAAIRRARVRISFGIRVKLAVTAQATSLDDAAAQIAVTHGRYSYQQWFRIRSWVRAKRTRLAYQRPARFVFSPHRTGQRRVCSV